jgi:nitrous oxidase accessory protein NosD
VKKLIRVVLALTTGALMFAALPARAQTTVVVDDDGMATPTNCGASAVTHDKIQEGVDAAAAGDTVKVCPGLYTENVNVAKTLIIRGAKAGVDAKTRTINPANESVVHSANPDLPIFMLQADGIVLNGFLVEGNTNNAGIQTSPTFSGYQLLNNVVRDNVFGIYLHGSGAATTVVRRNLLDNNNRPGAASGNGIYSDQGALGISIVANRTEDQTNAGILFASAATPQESILIQNNRSLNDNTFVALFNTQNATVVANRSNDTIDAGDFGSTIFVGGDSGAIVIQRNVLTNPGFAGIAVRDTLEVNVGAANVSILGNRVTGAEGSGIDVTANDFAAVTVRNNTLTNNGVGGFDGTGGDHGDGIRLGPLTNGNQIRFNTATGNFEFDCHDESTGAGTSGTANTWAGNNGNTDQPNGICP